MSWQVTYEKWMSFPDLDAELKQQLTDIRDDEKKLEESFYKELEFGTGGMRGELGPGTNRLNIYTMRKAAEGLARYIDGQGEEAKKMGVAIAYDVRFKSPEFSMEAAKVLATHGIKTYLFESLRSTPELSFAVRHLGCFSGIMVTASHNPPEYNGFKVYNQEGGQVLAEEAEAIVSEVSQVENELLVEAREEAALKAEGLIEMIGQQVDDAYQAELKTIIQQQDLIDRVGKDVKIIFTPLHGTANLPARRALREMGFSDVEIVKAQEEPDPTFGTVKSPNPEETEAFTLAIKQGQDVDADILVGTDPDGDRIGVATKNEAGEYVVLTGNQVGALMLDYLIEAKKNKGTFSKDLTVLKTIVTSEIGRDIATYHGLDTIDTLTGFKFIGEQIKNFETIADKSFLFGYEESYGYLIGDFVRDKDGIQAVMLAAEIAAYYKDQGKTLYQGLEELFEKYGYYYESLRSLTLKGKDGAEQIVALIKDFRENPPTTVAGKKVIAVEDYHASVRTALESQATQPIALPKSNVLKYFLEDGSWFCVRPSGTEPKVKFYIGVTGDAKIETKSKLNEIETAVMTRVDAFVGK